MRKDKVKLTDILKLILRIWREYFILPAYIIGKVYKNHDLLELNDICQVVVDDHYVNLLERI
jgi:hypothetical protein